MRFYCNTILCLNTRITSYNVCYTKLLRILINGHEIGIESKKKIAYLPEKTYLQNSMKVYELVDFFADFYEDFAKDRAYAMLQSLNIDSKAKLKTLSKGTKEKVQLILVIRITSYNVC